MPFLRNLYLNMVHLKFFYLTMVRSSPMTLLPMYVRSSILSNILQALTHPGQMEKMENLKRFLKASIRKLCQEDTAAWDQVLGQILFAYRCCPHTSTGEAPYTLLYNRDSPLPMQKLIMCIELYNSEGMVGKRNKQSWITLSTTAKMLERMWANQKRHYQHQAATHKYQVGDLVLLKKHNADKMELIWEPNYRVIRLASPWSAVVENQISHKTKHCNVGDPKPKHTSKDWELKPSTISKAARFINHPDNLSDVDITPHHDPTLPSNPKDNVGTIYYLRKSIKAPRRLDL